MTKMKICGLFKEADINYVNKYLPDYIGFVFTKSKRQVSYQEAKQLKDSLDKRIKVVGVFVDNEIKEIVTLVNEQIIDLIQLHGNEDNDYINLLKQQVKVPIIKAIKVIDKDSLVNLEYNVDYYLFDSLIGGSGTTFNWELIVNINKPYFIAGGINLDNIDDALKLNSYGIDVSSGVETKGIKDEAKIAEIIRRSSNGNR